MEKIIITIEDDIAPVTAMQAVQSVIYEGKVSQDTKGHKYYCWATTFQDWNNGKIIVFTKQTRNENTASFRVIKRKE